jgi:hypothetical protein
MFAVDDLDDTLDRRREHGAQLVDEWSSTSEAQVLREHVIRTRCRS